jgi:hypothetical protein
MFRVDERWWRSSVDQVRWKAARNQISVRFTDSPMLEMGAESLIAYMKRRDAGYFFQANAAVLVSKQVCDLNWTQIQINPNLV